MAQLQLNELREKEIFDTLKAIAKHSFVVIGGYAVNAYTLPRFSTDCDIVIKNHEELAKIEKELLKLGYKKTNETSEVPYDGNYARYVKSITPDFRVSMDVLIREVLDRQTGGRFSADWIFDNASQRVLRGKTISEKLNLNIINVEALFAMKFVSCRLTDIRDDFLLANLIKDNEWVKKEVSERCDFKERFFKLAEEIESEQFKDGLQGVFGRVDDKLFERNKEKILEFEPELKKSFIKELKNIEKKVRKWERK